LTDEEYRIIRGHVFHSYHALDMLGLDEIKDWAALHHERVDGTGYPFGLKQLPLGSRMMAVADVFTAITEDRPYRAGMGKEKAFSVLESMAESNQLDDKIVDIILTNYKEFNSLRNDIQIRYKKRTGAKS
ncbi:MAG: HD-GYP domain-containing protein, partial [Bacillota bacterium]